jgi:hypothetical protein
MFEMKALFLEPGVVADDTLLEAQAAAIRRCARWHGATRVRRVRALPLAVARRLRQALRRRRQETP